LEENVMLAKLPHPYPLYINLSLVTRAIPISEGAVPVPDMPGYTTPGKWTVKFCFIGGEEMICKFKSLDDYNEWMKLNNL
jgi:hypothetical protein